MISFNAEVGDSAKQAGLERLENARVQNERERLQFEKQKAMIEAFDRNEDRKLKEKDIDTKLKIAHTNKNKYDK